MKKNNGLIRIIVGFDQREAVAYHTFCQSIISRTSSPIQFIPLAKNSIDFYTEAHEDGSNDFVYSRFLTPFLCNFTGKAIYADGDMICLSDINELISLFNPDMALQVVKHDYKTKAFTKYLGNSNEDYPRKNWSSLVLWNCEHPLNRVLMPEYVQSKSGSFLHRFSWLPDDLIGSLPIDWNWLASEYESISHAKLVHYTLGTPCFKAYEDSDMSELWWNEYRLAIQGISV